MAKKEVLEFEKQLEKITNKYGVTPAGTRLLGVVARPESRTMTVTAICEQAEISRDWYYAQFRDERFIQAYTELCRAMLLSAAAPASQALAAQAAMGDVAAIKMILEMAALYSPTATLNINQDTDNKPGLKALLKKKKS